MAAADQTKPIIGPPARQYSVMAGVLSYLIPGLGQIYQGRFLKGLLFMVCLLGLFFYGMKLGSWSNVYLPDISGEKVTWRLESSPFLTNIGPSGRPLFAGQMCIGVAAWPALLQYNGKWSRIVPRNDAPLDSTRAFWANFESPPTESTINDLQADGDKSWDLGWVYTVIAGVLNILVIYDAFAGPAFFPESKPAAPKEEAVPV